MFVRGSYCNATLLYKYESYAQQYLRTYLVRGFWYTATSLWKVPNAEEGTISIPNPEQVADKRHAAVVICPLFRADISTKTCPRANVKYA